MSLSQLEVLSFRNIQQATLTPSTGVNGFYGDNGSGKTSLLETIYFLGHFRSFRAQHAASVIGDDSEFALVRGRTTGGDQLAVQRGRSKRHQLRLNQEPIVRSSALAAVLPTMVFDPNTIQLVLGEPERRRRFLNWGLFHVKPQFSEEWRACARALHQRNQLLKLGRSNDALSDWTRVLAAHSEVIDGYREVYYQQLRLEFLRLTQLLGRFDGLKLEYRRGWPSEMSLAEALQADLATDLRRGFSQKGLHRSDLRLSVGGRSVIEHYSRGEAKMLAWALSLAQLSCLPGAVRQKTILLVDDPVAEIDGDHGQLISRCLTENGPQIFTTSTDPEALKQFWGDKLNRLFHVKQGIIRDTGGDHYE